MRTLLAPAALLFAAACSTAPATTGSPAPMGGTTTMTTTTSTTSSAAVNPVGAYSFATMVGGDNVTGTIEISGTPGAYTGRIVSSALPELPVRSATANGQQLTINAETPQGPVVMVFNFTGMEFTGTWSLGGDGGPLTGRRTR
ncbi:MAG TPA: hypothetical protein VF665_10845 [Longimicrobium sp.]|jgi:hypothetical protein|uniref:hypothetical protein n=1 Tax=Longimicrobium sp. TaxID=2029185 RepID=UPI002ED9708B